MSAHRSSSGPEGALLHGEFMAFVGDEESLGIIGAFAQRQGFPAATVQMGGPDMFAQMLEQAAPPKLAIVDMDGQSDPVATATRLIGLCGPDHRIIAIGSANDVGLYRRMMGAGIADYLVKPLNAEILSQAYSAALRGGIAGKSDVREAKVVIMIGVRGGVGTSTIAINTGWLLGQKFKFQCAMLDLDLQYGTSALALDLEPGRGLRDMVASPQRVDSLMVASSMVAASDQLSVLGAEEAIEEAVPVDSSAITALLKEMSGNFDFILVDLPRHMLASQKRLLAAAHQVVLVSEFSLAGIRDTLRIKNALAALGGAGNLMLVMSRINAAHPGQIDQASFEKGAQLKIDFTVPDDPKSVTLAANAGKPLGAVAADAPMTKILHALAAKLSGKSLDKAEAKKGMLGWLFAGTPAPAKGEDAKPRKADHKKLKDKP